MKKHVLIIDNYDSFVYNLGRYCQELGAETHIFRNDALTIKDIKNLKPTHIILSPGPCTPKEAGICNDIITELGHQIPILGVCLGHQCIGHVFGAQIIQSEAPMHGKTSIIDHNNQGIFQELKNPLTVMRYHSLMIDSDTMPDCLRITSQTKDGIIMSIQHKKHPLYGVQFHPESVCSEQGHALIANFLQTKN